MNAENRKIYGVAELTRLIRSTLEDEVGEVWVEGEISNLRAPASGHLYFTIKDENAQLAAVMFRGNRLAAACQPRDGLKFRLFGLVSVYEKNGQYQMIVRLIEPAGAGALQAAFEALKKRLAAEGLFDRARKKPLPLLPRHIGVVTSPSGAVIHDILNVALSRFPNLHVVLFPVRVQGEGAAADIAEAIDAFNARGDIDVLIVARGGGSLEDLWPFNEEIVARAVARSGIPVVSAVGHETDFTICDFAADLRAPTPSAAAELVVGRKADFTARLQVLARRIAGTARAVAAQARLRVTAAGKSYVFREPGNAARAVRDRIDRAADRMVRAARARVESAQQSLDGLYEGLPRSAAAAIQMWRADFNRLMAQLRVLNPAAVLERGYSITYRARNSILRDPNDARPGDLLTTRLARGAVRSRVEPDAGGNATEK